jgi:hypothetical protein
MAGGKKASPRQRLLRFFFSVRGFCALIYQRNSLREFRLIFGGSIARYRFLIDIVEPLRMQIAAPYKR